MVRHHGIFPEPLVAAYMYQALDGLTYLHDQGVIHRDIKGQYGSINEALPLLIPWYFAIILLRLYFCTYEELIIVIFKGANILISTDGTVKLADFGVATRVRNIHL